jgi:antigen flippase
MIARVKNFPISARTLRVRSHAAYAISPEKSTYGQILHSSSLIGVSSVLNIAFGIIGTKAVAVLLGPAGFGLMAIYS